MRKVTNLVGKSFGQLTVLSQAGWRGKQSAWKCQCSCGNTKVIIGASLSAKRTTSCGCFHKRQLSERSISHGKTGTPEHFAWKAMKQRGSNKNLPQAKDYVLRGIHVCDRWENSFQHFLDDLGERPSPEYSIERHDNHRGYCPCNTYWATRLMQENNKRSNRVITANGVTNTLAQWSRLLGIPYDTLRARLNRGWTPEKTMKPA